MINFETWNILHQKQAEKDVKKIDKIYDEVIKLISLHLSSQILKSDVIFELSKFPYLKRQIDSLLKRYARNVEIVIEDSVAKHWNLANSKLNTFENQFFKSVKVSKKPINKRNLEGLKAFKNRPNRMLSTRVWSNTQQMREQIEMAIDVAIKEGTPANQLASELKKYLKEPDRLYRKYRDKNGQLQLSKKAKAYNPGRGVYRSSFKNAQRLARTEINMAYRLADIERFQSSSFVIGYEVKRSKHPYPCDICDVMAGVYPKNFIWSGNHPNCRCYIVPILQREKDFLNSLNDKNEPEQIRRVNPKFTKWVAENKQRILMAEKRGTLPYFLEDNRDVWKNVVKKPKKLQLVQTLV